MSSPAPQYVIGTQGFGAQWTAANVSALVDRIEAEGLQHFDTAALYPPTNPGASEKLLGSVRKSDFTIDTKILFRPEALRKDQMEESLRQSLKSLGVTKVTTLYAHTPDPATPIADQAANFDHLHRAGYFEQLGLCNYSPADLTAYIEAAKSAGYILPTIYQGQYNLFCRDTASITFVANSPLAGGFATGKLTFAPNVEQLKGTRFEAAEGNIMGFLYRMWYDKPVFHDAVRELAAAVGRFESQGVSSLGQAAARWLLFHSALQSTDLVIIGPSKLSQFEEYLATREAGPLPEELAKQIDGLYTEEVRQAAAPLVQHLPPFTLHHPNNHNHNSKHPFNFPNIPIPHPPLFLLSCPPNPHPYATKAPLGDLPALHTHLTSHASFSHPTTDTKTFITYLIQTLNTLRTPLAQRFPRPLPRKPTALDLTHFPTAYKLLFHRINEFGRSPSISDLVVGIVRITTFT
ncbi:Aldo/keto reductase [Aspergillus sclerotiicarbonarius CBS 121057]|uniref:Aldo/keto reductase n=1 Tax=Aspergillus sclerotiicarbonarius (strain CBS 121057 / IBT 28362) TaxID=1448318 RepID=A0A319EUT0_ASPSB|nr:Aldo/keto reductase [Aspergillus sclerotiicarbonarius CBS 121057]